MFICQLSRLGRRCFSDPWRRRQGRLVGFANAEEGDGQLGVGWNALEDSAVGVVSIMAAQCFV